MLEAFGRHAELDALRRFLGAVDQGARALVLEGEAGIGKTTLWNAGMGLARERGFRVLTARSAESETTLSYAGLGDVLREMPNEALESLPEIQRLALEVALLRAEPGEIPVDHHTVAAGTLGALRWFASTGSVLAALDDPQWMDAASRETLSYAVRRLGDEPIGILSAVRIGEGLDDPLELARALRDERLQRLKIGPLSVEALGRMLNRCLGREITGSALFELHTVSGGNPLFALEIARASMEDTKRSLVVPRSLQEQVSGRIAALPQDTREALVVAASLPQPTLKVIEQVINRDGETLGPAVRMGAVEVHRGMVRFTHPLYASVAYAGAAEEDRARIHRCLADLAADPEERARHLALSATPTDADVADALETAADRARSRGAPMVAAELCLEAHAFTPEDRPQDRRRRAVLAADDLYVSGNSTRTKELLEQALAGCPGGPERAQVLWRLGRLACWGEATRIDAADEWLDLAEKEAGEDPWVRSKIYRMRFILDWKRVRCHKLPEHARLALEMAERASDPVGVAGSLAAVVQGDAVTGRGLSDDLVDRAIDAWAEAARSQRGFVSVSEDHPALLCGVAYLWMGRLDEARSMFQMLRQESIERGSELGWDLALFFLVEIELLAGNWELVAGYADEKSQLAQQHTGAMALTGRGGTFSAYVGRVNDARRDLTQDLAEQEAGGLTDGLLYDLSDLGFLELSLGNLAEAQRYLSRTTEIFTQSGIRDPGLGREVRFLADAIEVLVGLGELAEAKRHTDWLEKRGRELDRPWAIAVGARCRGLLLAARGDHDTAIAHLERALREHERLPMPFERARTLLVLGTIRRRAGRKRAAREALQEALATFEHLGARLWAEKARAELAAIGGRPAVTGGLTPTEERVARLAAAGRTNREIAQELYLSVRTVETHLSRAYRKLEVRSRTELATVLDASVTT